MIWQVFFFFFFSLISCKLLWLWSVCPFVSSVSALEVDTLVTCPSFDGSVLLLDESGRSNLVDKICSLESNSLSWLMALEEDMLVDLLYWGVLGSTICTLCDDIVEHFNNSSVSFSITPPGLNGFSLSIDVPLTRGIASLTRFWYVESTNTTIKSSRHSLFPSV